MTTTPAPFAERANQHALPGIYHGHAEDGKAYRLVAEDELVALKKAASLANPPQAMSGAAEPDWLALAQVGYEASQSSLIEPGAVWGSLAISEQLCWMAAAEAIYRASPSLSGAAEGAVPVGMKLVPIEPTEAMLNAAYEAHDAKPLSGWGKVVDATDDEIYRAMVAAAPSLSGAALAAGERKDAGERNQCDGCAVDAYINRWGHHCMPDGGRMCCTANRYNRTTQESSNG